MKKDLTNIIGYIYKITAPNGAVYVGQTLCVKKRKKYLIHLKEKRTDSMERNTQMIV